MVFFCFVAWIKFSKFSVELAEVWGPCSRYGCNEFYWIEFSCFVRLRGWKLEGVAVECWPVCCNIWIA